MVETDVPVRPPREFGTVLLEHAKGRSHDELTARLTEIARAVQETGKAGTLTYSLKIKPARNVDGMVTLEDTITAKVPEYDRPATAYFVTEDGALTLEHPHQAAMFSVVRDEADR